jgi:methionyl-tRNA formyltransferase
VKPFRVVYFGTPEYAVPALEELHRDSRADVALVVTQPDRPAGRGHRVIAPAVKQAATELGIPVYQPESLRVAELRQPIVDADADLFVVAAYGLIFGEKTLAIPRRGALNLHASILPAYRGANPIAAAIANGDPETGVSLMVMERGLDSGPVISVRRIPISPTDTTASLTQRLAEIAGRLVTDELFRYLDGELAPEPQPRLGVSLARPMRKADGEIDWSMSAVDIDRHVRATWPWPRAWTRLGEIAVQVHAVSVAVGKCDGAPGTITVADAVRVATGDGTIELQKVQFPGKSAVEARSAARGGHFPDGATFEAVSAQREPLVTTAGDCSTNA